MDRAYILAAAAGTEQDDLGQVVVHAAEFLRTVSAAEQAVKHTCSSLTAGAADPASLAEELRRGRPMMAVSLAVGLC
jgi:hypothetical protein